MRIETCVIDSPVGRIGLAWRGRVLVLAQMDVAESRTEWETTWAPGTARTRMRAALEARFPGARIGRGSADARIPRALRRYFDGDLAAIDGVEVDPGGTPFQARVWRELRRIPPGTTRTYAQIAARAGRPGAARAAGGAVGANPIPLVVPCHRVVGANGALTGFGGGLERKRRLLEHEGALAPGARRVDRQLALI